MTAHVLRDVECWLAQYRLRGQMNSCALEDAIDVATTPVFGDAAQRRVPQLYSPSCGMEGYYSAEDFDKPAQDNLGVANVPLSVAPLGAEVGSRAYLMRVMGGELSWGGAVGDANPFSMSVEGSDGGRLVRGYVMHASEETASGGGVAVNVGALPSGSQLYAALHVLEASDGDTLDVSIVSDNAEGFGSGVAQTAFAQVTAAGSQWIELDGPVTDDWWRVEWSIGGGSPSFNFVVTIGII